MTINIKSIGKKLFNRRKATIPVVYGISGIFLAVIGLFGFNYGAALIFWPLAFVCFSLMIYPTLFAWGIIASCFVTASIAYIGFTIFELLTQGTNSTIFSDNIIVYILYVAVILLLTFGIFAAIPPELKDNKNANQALNIDRGNSSASS